MTDQTKVSAKGQVVIPKDVRDALAWLPGTTLDVERMPEGVILRTMREDRPFGRTTLKDLQVLKVAGARQPVAAISRLSEDDIRRLGV